MKLLEILVALSLLVILSSVGLISYQSLVAKEHVKQVKVLLLTALHDARERSLHGEYDIGVCLINARQECVNEAAEGLMVFSVDHFGERRKIHRIIHFRLDAGSLLKLSSFPHYRSFLKFSRSPSMGHDNGSLNFYASDHTKKFSIVINKMGRIETRS